MVSSNRRVKFDDFELFECMWEKGSEKVYSATRKKDGRKVAVKFFGYTSAKPNILAIDREISLMIRLDHVEGVCQLLGIFDDTPEGLVPNKNSLYLQSYPVIVQEFLEGENLLMKLSSCATVSENYLSICFKSLLLAVQSVHERGYIHRDLKLENIVCFHSNDITELKIIDFGLMTDIPYPEQVVTASHVMGTEGNFAPETLLRCEYSYKTDVWQLGCILYCLLAGHSPFHARTRIRQLITSAEYYPLKGSTWDHISPEAKDLVSRLLVADPSMRLSIENCLQHPWLTFLAEKDNNFLEMDDAHKFRIGSLAMKSKIQHCFVKRQVSSDRDYYRGHFLKDLFFFNKDLIINYNKWGIRNSWECFFRCSELKSKRIAEDIKTNHYHDYDNFGGPCQKKRRLQHSKLPLDMDFNEFCSQMQKIGFNKLATPDTFNTLVSNHNGVNDLNGFLMSHGYSNDEDDEVDWVYSSYFDVDEEGRISLEQMIRVMKKLLHDRMGPSFADLVSDRNMEQLFCEIDADKSGRISVEEFKLFYNYISSSSAIRKV